MKGPGANEDGDQGLLALRPQHGQLQGSRAGSPQARNLNSRYRLKF